MVPGARGDLSDRDPAAYSGRWVPFGSGAGLRRGTTSLVLPRATCAGVGSAGFHSSSEQEKPAHSIVVAVSVRCSMMRTPWCYTRESASSWLSPSSVLHRFITCSGTPGRPGASPR